MFSFRLSRRSANDPDDLVNVGQREQQTFDYVLSLPRPCQFELRASAYDDCPMANELVKHRLERHHPGLAIDQSQQIDGKRILQWRELIELVQHNVRIRISFEFNNQPHGLFQIAFVANAADSWNASVSDQRRDLFHDAIALCLIRNLTNDDAITILLILFDRRPPPYHNRTATGVVPAANTRSATDNSAGGKIRSLDNLEQLIDRHIRFFDHADHRVADLAQVVRRNRRRHADRDSIGPIDQQVGKLAGQHDRLGAFFVIRWYVVDRVELHIVQHHGRHGGYAGLGVTHGSRR